MILPQFRWRVSNVFSAGRVAVGWRIERGAGYALAALALPTAPANGTWPLEHPVVASVGWLVLLLAVFVPLCSARYARG